jgi:hypothetical protein
MMRARRNQVNFDFLQLPFDRAGIKFCADGDNPKPCACRQKDDIMKQASIMRVRWINWLCVAGTFLPLATSQSMAASVSWSVSVFDAPLGGCGNWVERPGYGRCWYPTYVSSSWYPYCEGYWMWTDQGWYWVSTEQWAWATYHYGRWVNDSYYGWVWTPDTEWGPSWVSWREGGGYVGWAPLPFGAVIGVDGGVVYRGQPMPDRFFMFVEIGHFSEPIHRNLVIVNKTTIINKTVNITSVTRVNGVVVNHGPKVDEIQRVSARKLTESVPRAALERSANARVRESAPTEARPATAEERRQPVNEEKRVTPEPEPRRESTPPSGETAPRVNQPPEKERAAPPPAKPKPPAEKPEHPEKANEEPKKGEQGGN